MALNTRAAGHSTLRGTVEIRDPSASAPAFLATYRRCPGVTSFTMPDDQAASSDVVLLDGITQASGFSTVGTIAVPIGTFLPAHEVHKFLDEAKASGDNVLVRFRTIPTVRAAGTVQNNGTDIPIAISASGVLTVTGSAAAAGRVILDRLLRRGGIFAAAASTLPASPPATAFYAVQTQKEAPADPGTVESWIVTRVDGTAISALTAGVIGHIRMPGAEWSDVLCKVTGFGGGDAQSAALLSTTLTLTPDTPIRIATASSAAAFTYND